MIFPIYFQIQLLIQISGLHSHSINTIKLSSLPWHLNAQMSAKWSSSADSYPLQLAISTKPLCFNPHTYFILLFLSAFSYSNTNSTVQQSSFSVTTNHLFIYFHSSFFTAGLIFHHLLRPILSYNLNDLLWHFLITIRHVHRTSSLFKSSYISSHIRHPSPIWTLWRHANDLVRLINHYSCLPNCNYVTQAAYLFLFSLILFSALYFLVTLSLTRTDNVWV